MGTALRSSVWVLGENKITYVTIHQPLVTVRVSSPEAAAFALVLPFIFFNYFQNLGQKGGHDQRRDQRRDQLRKKSLNFWYLVDDAFPFVLWRHWSESLNLLLVARITRGHADLRSSTLVQVDEKDTMDCSR